MEIIMINLPSAENPDEPVEEVVAEVACWISERINWPALPIT